MFNIFKPKPSGTTVTLKLSGLHCSSCSLNIDSEIEDLPGVISISTSYAKQESVITYDPTLIDPSHFKPIIEKLGYKVIS
ncbi:MAG: ATPase, Cu++ transporting, beta polypeptide [uncultured bacterium]|nr:MAG: ATPase, Cu++ transporting, beta polypeptide [uncultured bacterium]